VYIYRSWSLTPEIEYSKGLPHLGFSIIIPARNESTHIRYCLEAIQQGNYPEASYEIIIIDDHSTDNTAEIVFALEYTNVRCVTLPEGVTGKKAGITLGVSMAQFPYILCTDADSLPGNNWIRSHAYMYSIQELNVATGMVMPLKGHTVLDHFQWMDFAATMAITAAGIQSKHWFLGNGANFSFTKAFFQQVGGFADNMHIASGDDIFLIHKASEADQSKIAFVKSITGLVLTQPMQSWRALLEQRKRWATKALKTKDQRVSTIQGFVFLMSVLIVAGITFGGLISLSILIWTLVALVVKMLVDYIFLKKMAHYYQQKVAVSFFIPAFFVYLLHILYSGWQAIFPGNYKWKNRELS
jgi:cellulose synthase/poly-beta-1,6-N-acetylglucosamine synthase-like glycosyltransferase